MSEYQIYHGPLWRLRAEIAGLSAMSALSDAAKRHLADMRFAFHCRTGLWV